MSQGKQDELRTANPREITSEMSFRIYLIKVEGCRGHLQPSALDGVTRCLPVYTNTTPI